MNNDNEVAKLVELLKNKYESHGQDFKSYLEGMLYQKYTTYWDYVHTDSLLSLQNPITAIPDEMIFIIYHQITELYFKLTLHEMQQIADKAGSISVEFFIERLRRMNAYFRNLTYSFEIMVDGMEKEQFLKFRMSLLPASGFQSAQYRMIEICATDLINLVDKNFRDQVKADSTVEERFKYIYWQAGATELSSGKKTLTLTQFDEKYSAELKMLAEEYKNKNLLQVYKLLPETDRGNEVLKNELKKFDESVNINWPLMHYKSAVRYLHQSPEDIAATGGTNWQKYLPPRFQKRIFYPDLYTSDEMENWGRRS